MTNVQVYELALQTSPRLAEKIKEEATKGRNFMAEAKRATAVKQGYLLLEADAFDPKSLSGIVNTILNDSETYRKSIGLEE